MPFESNPTLWLKSRDVRFKCPWGILVCALQVDGEIWRSLRGADHASLTGLVDQNTHSLRVARRELT